MNPTDSENIKVWQEKVPERPNEATFASETDRELVSWTRRLQLWHGAGTVLAIAIAIAIVGLLLYAFWPAVMGRVATQGPDREEEDTAEVPVEEAVVEAVVASEGAFGLQAEATGHLAAWRRAQVSADVGGPVTARLVEEGQYVRQGQVLFRLDDRDEQIEREEAERAYEEGTSCRKNWTPRASVCAMKKVLSGQNRASVQAVEWGGGRLRHRAGRLGASGLAARHARGA